MRDHARKPSVAALNPQIVQRNFAIFSSITPLFRESSSHSVSDAERVKDVSSGEKIFGTVPAALQSTHGFGTTGTGAGDRDAAGGEDAGAGSGRSDGTESFRTAEAE